MLDDLPVALEEVAPSPPAPDGDAISLWEYFSTVFVPENRLELPLKPAHREICDAIQMALLGTLPEGIEFVVINCPPRIGKTKIMEAAACWLEAYFPDAQIMLTGYSADLAQGSLAYIAKTLREPWHVEVFGDILHGRKADHLSTTEGGNLYARGIEGTLTGKGAGLKRPAGGFIGIDDAAKPDEALSPVMAENVRQAFETTIKNRRNSDRWCPVIIIGQRLAPGDLPGYILKTYPAQTLLLKFPALVDPVTGKASNADDAISAFPETVSTATLHAYKATGTGRFVLASQYQQEPVAWGGNMFQTPMFPRFDVLSRIVFERRVITIDTALTAKTSSNSSAVQLWGLKERRAYLNDALFGKWESPELLVNVGKFWESHANEEGQPRPDLTVELKAAGTGLMQQLQRLGIPVRGIERNKDKVQRAQQILPFCENHFVLFPRDDQISICPWLPGLLDELMSFSRDGTSPNDDQVDALIDGIEQLLGIPPSILDVLLTSMAPAVKAPPRRAPAPTQA